MHGILHYGLTYTKGQPGFMDYTDVDWSGPLIGNRIGRWLFMIGGAPIFWSSNRQELISQSSYESENYMLNEARKKEVWLRF